MVIWVLGPYRLAKWKIPLRLGYITVFIGHLSWLLQGIVTNNSLLDH